MHFGTTDRTTLRCVLGPHSKARFEEEYLEFGIGEYRIMLGGIMLSHSCTQSWNIIPYFSDPFFKALKFLTRFSVFPHLVALQL